MNCLTRLGSAAAALAFVGLVSACGGSPRSSSPSVVPTGPSAVAVACSAQFGAFKAYLKYPYQAMADETVSRMSLAGDVVEEALPKMDTQQADMVRSSQSALDTLKVKVAEGADSTTRLIYFKVWVGLGASAEFEEMCRAAGAPEYMKASPTPQ